VVARGVESHLELLVHGAVQALDLLASAFLYGVELKLLRGAGALVGANKKGVRGIDTVDQVVKIRVPPSVHFKRKVTWRPLAAHDTRKQKALLEDVDVVVASWRAGKDVSNPEVVVAHRLQDNGPLARPALVLSRR